MSGVNSTNLASPTRDDAWLTVAFPAVSAGIYGWPHEDAARIALTTVSQASCQVAEARFVLFTPDMHAIFVRVHAGLKPS